MEVGFCDCDLRGFSLQQPTCQHDRWDLPVSNGTHLLITWRPDRRLCGMNVSSYFLDVRTSTPLVNFFMGIFGAFPQDMCDPRGSKARDAVHAADARGRTCSTYPRRCDFGRQTSFELPPALKKVVQTGVQVSTMAYGTISPPGDPAVRSNVTFWCHVYRWRAQGRPRSPPAPSQARWGVGHSTVRVGLQRRGGGELDSSNAMSSAYEEHVRQKAALEPVVLGVSILVFLAARTLRRTFRKVPSAGNSRSTDAAAASGTAWGSLPVLALVEATLPLLVFVVAPFTFVLLARDSSTKDLGLPDPQGAIWNILIPSGNIALIQACCTILLCPSCIEAHGFAEKLLGEHINITPQLAFHFVDSWRGLFIFGWVLPAVHRSMGPLSAYTISSALYLVADEGDLGNAVSMIFLVATPIALTGEVLAGWPFSFAMCSMKNSLKNGQTVSWQLVCVHFLATAIALVVLWACCPVEPFTPG